MQALKPGSEDSAPAPSHSEWGHTIVAASRSRCPAVHITFEPEEASARTPALTSPLPPLA